MVLIGFLRGFNRVLIGFSGVLIRFQPQFGTGFWPAQCQATAHIGPTPPPQPRRTASLGAPASAVYGCGYNFIKTLVKPY
jgi:hypothetical protein